VLKETEGALGIVEMMEASGALLSGHFELASGFSVLCCWRIP
jgi:hypothetical protein